MYLNLECKNQIKHCFNTCIFYMVNVYIFENDTCTGNSHYNRNECVVFKAKGCARVCWEGELSIFLTYCINLYRLVCCCIKGL